MYMVVLLLGIAYGWWLREYVFPMRKRFSSKHEESADKVSKPGSPESESAVTRMLGEEFERSVETLCDRNPPGVGAKSKESGIN